MVGVDSCVIHLVPWVADKDKIRAGVTQNIGSLWLLLWHYLISKSTCWWRNHFKSYRNGKSNVFWCLTEKSWQLLALLLLLLRWRHLKVPLKFDILIHQDCLIPIEKDFKSADSIQPGISILLFVFLFYRLEF